MKDDAISRQAVLKLLSTMPPEETITKAMLIQNVKYMSAAQPEKRTEERTETHACDLINRWALMGSLVLSDKTGKISCEQMKKVLEVVEAQPPAATEHHCGKWIPVTNGRGGHECSSCHNYAPSFQTGDEWLTDYCPCCGADMR